MPRRPAAGLRATAPWRVLDGFGGSTRAACRYAAPRTAEELAATLARARKEGLSVAFRGAGRSYGDASLNRDGLVIDATGLDRLLRWEPETGLLEAEAGLTIEGLWRRTLEDGYWPAVVPGTMRPTLGGCIAMNVHGKNNFKVGTFGEHVEGFELLTPGGEALWCGREDHPEIFHAAIGGLGLLGAVTRVKLKLKRVGSGRLRVEGLVGRSFGELFDLFESRLGSSDYVVGWVDGTTGGRGLGRGQIHAARHLAEGEDPEGRASLHVERQGLPPRIFGLPRSLLWRFMRPFTNGFGLPFVNFGKYQSSRWSHGATYLQSHVAFAFLLDYVPNWRLAYGPGGLIQYQAFVPHEQVRSAFPDLLAISQKAGLPPYLGVLKRHRPDPFLLTHGLDGWSLALDYRVTAENRQRLWALTGRLTERVLAAGGRFYLAKDSVLKPEELERAYGREALRSFLDLKARLDPEGVLVSDLWARTRPVA